MDCIDMRTELQAYVDGELDHRRTTLLKRHLTGCKRCQAELERLRITVKALETWPIVAEPDQLTARVMAQITPLPLVNSVPSHIPPHFRLRWSDLLISLAGGGLAFIAILLWRHSTIKDLFRLYGTWISLQTHMLKLKALLHMRLLFRVDNAIWWLLIASMALIIALIPLIWPVGMWRRRDILR